jgi:hypothetical protein
MARPKKDSFDYFPHDTDAANDEKIEAMRATYGNDGYAFYFILLERIYKKNGVLDVKTPAIMTAIQRNITSDSELFQKMLNTAFEIDLFDKGSFDEKGIITSKAIESRTLSVNSERARKREWAKGKKVLDVENTANRRQLTPKVKDKVKVKDNIIPLSPPNGEGDAFNTFWQAYPKKVAKPQALKAFNKLKPDNQLLQQMLSAIEKQKKSPEWTKQSGQFIPYPGTWLNDYRWEDEQVDMPAQGKELQYLC